MGWQTDLFCNITFNRQTYNSLYEVDDRIAELTEYINYTKGVIRALAIMTEPNKLLSCEEGEDPLTRIERTIQESLEDLEEYYVERWKLEMLQASWPKCHNEEGLAINPPECAQWPNAYLDGDFVKSVDHPNGH